MRLAELIGEAGRATPEISGGSLEITGLTADSREVRPGYLFAALPGVQDDGARFIADAIKRGAAAILLPPQIAEKCKGTAPDNQISSRLA